MSDSRYPPLEPQHTGLRGRCPRCGEGDLFSGFLQVAPSCNRCGLDYTFADAGDGPAFFVGFLGCFLAAAFTVWMELSVGAPIWLNALLSLPFALAICIIPLRPAKGFFIAQQYVKNARPGEIDKPGA